MDQDSWAHYSPVAGPSTSPDYDTHIFDNLQLLTSDATSPTTYYFSDPSSSSLYYYDHHPPNNNGVIPYAYSETAAPNVSEVTPVTQPDGMQNEGMEMTTIPDILPSSMESFIFNASTMEQFDGNANVESARERVGLGGDSVLPGMKVTLMPHQITGVAWMLDKEDKEKGGCLGDEMGLGKNRSDDNSKKTTLILTPTSLLDQWRQELEIKTDCGLKCLIYHGSKRTKYANELLQYDVVLTSYNTMSNEWAESDGNSADRTSGRRRRSEAGPLFRLEFYRIVLDEAQSIRNKWTVTSRAVCDLKAVYRWCLTGTPIINTLMDVYGYLRFLRIEPWCDIHEFRSRVGEQEKKNPNLAAKRLQAILKLFLLRRKKDSTLDGKRLIELPDKTIDLVKLEFSPEEREIYNMVEARTQAKFNRFLRAGTVLKNYHQVLVLLLRLRQICSHPSLIQEEGMDSAESNGLTIDPVKEQTRASTLVSPQFVEKVKRKFLETHEARILSEKESSRDAVVEDDECPICFDTLTDSVITACSHIFCRECISEAIDHSRPIIPDFGETGIKYGTGERPCPVCRAAISKDKLFSCAAFEPTDETDPTKDGGNNMQTSDKDAVESKIDAWNNSHCPPPSTKMKHMMQQLQNLMSERPEEKVLIVSQWTSCLSLVSKYLQEVNILHVNYRGDMDRSQRSQAVKDFTCNAEIRVMLMSLKCGGVGLNLTRANHVISLDLGWSQAVEAQAFDRVHRLGQNRPVTVQRLAIANTVEDRVLQMQERKQALTDGSLGEGSGKKIKFSIRELANLFGLDQYGHVLNV
ncbi:SNF2 family N-terminal domain-containing protein [Cyathus striatus]|nr:SNF2 family N-terminal domain-containing protein [Cyathus striatus]